MKAIKTVALVIIVFPLLFSGVFALWSYPSVPPIPTETILPMKMVEFKEYKGVYIKSVEVVSTSNAQVTDNKYTRPTFHKTTVDANRSGGSVTYKIRLHNNTDTNYWYMGMSIPAGEGQNALINAYQGISIVLKDLLSDSTATFNKDDRIPPQTERDVYVTYTYGNNAQTACFTNIELCFGIRMDAVQDEFLTLLNNLAPGYNYYYLTETFDKTYNNTGSTTITTESHPEAFANMFGDLTVDMDGQEKTAHIVIRRENLDNDATSGDKYASGTPAGCEYTLYITVESLTPGTSPTVYAISYSKGANGMGSDWYQIGELYEGTAPIKADGSIDYDNWVATHKTYEIADGIEYLVGAPNGDQYDIMNSMEQLISAVDQDIFNQIDNTNIFKKVYDILQKHPGSTDPAVVGLKKAFDDASIFYRNMNNGQEFKVVRDKYTRAEIIYALQNIQAALDYYYETGH